MVPTHPVLRYYTGKESAEETIAIFANAIGIVAFHGAGLANALFATAPTCVVEMTALTDPIPPKYPQPAQWRSNRRVADTNVLVDWRIVHVNTTEINLANGRPPRGHMTKHVQWVPLSAHNIENVEKELTHCLRARRHRETQHGIKLESMGYGGIGENAYGRGFREVA